MKRRRLFCRLPFVRAKHPPSRRETEGAHASSALPNKCDGAINGFGGVVVNKEAGCIVDLKVHRVTKIDVHDMGTGDGAETGRKPTSTTFESIPHQFTINR